MRRNGFARAQRRYDWITNPEFAYGVHTLRENSENQPIASTGKSGFGSLLVVRALTEPTIGVEGVDLLWAKLGSWGLAHCACGTTAEGFSQMYLIHSHVSRAFFQHVAIAIARITHTKTVYVKTATGPFALHDVKFHLFLNPPFGVSK